MRLHAGRACRRARRRRYGRQGLRLSERGRLARPVLHFSHANGFPAPCYEAMLAPLRERYRVGWIEAIGTDPGYPPTEGWPRLVEQLIDALERDYGGEPVFAVGHSLGAYLSFLAAVRRPELFRAIVLLDAPVIGAFKGRALGVVKRLGMVDRFTPAGMTRERRSVWTTREEAKAHFRSKKLFRSFTDECLEHYVRFGLMGAPGRFRLLIDPEIEYRIYRTIPHGMGRHLRSLKVPAGFVGGEDSDVLRRVGLGAMRGPRFAKLRVPGGHLFPFEHPLLAAAAVAELLGRLAA